MDENSLLIKLGPADGISSRYQETLVGLHFLMFYDFNKDFVISVESNYSKVTSFFD